MPRESDEFKSLPVGVAGAKDLASLLMETESMRDSIKSLASKGRGSEASIPPRIASFFEANEIKTVNQEMIDGSISWLKSLLQHAPKIHVALTAVPDAKERGALVSWIRREILPTALVEFSLYPGLGGGCIVRTPVRIYDFSVRSVLQKRLPEFKKVLTETEA